MRLNFDTNMELSTDHTFEMKIIVRLIQVSSYDTFKHDIFLGLITPFQFYEHQQTNIL